MLEDGGKKAQEELAIVVKDKGGKKTNLDVLQYTLATVSGLAFLLLLLLLAILLKRKLASKFKLFDEKNVADDYQTMSSFPSTGIIITIVTYTPSPLLILSSSCGCAPEPE